MARTGFNRNNLQNYAFALNDYYPLKDLPVGNIFFVNSGSGNNSAPPNYGMTPDAPWLSIAYAFSSGYLTVNNDDYVFVMPGHVETITSAAGVNANVAGVNVIGLGYDRGRPQINYTTSGNASFDINAPNILLKNLYFTPIGVASVVAALNVKASDCWIQDCEIEFANSTNQATQVVLTTASANRMRLSRLHMHGANYGPSTAAISIVGGTDIVIEDNIIQGSFTTTVGGIQNLTTAAINLIIARNIIQNLTTSSTKAITALSGTSGQGSDNRMVILSGSAPVTGAGMGWTGNYYQAALGVGSPSTLL